MNKQALYFEPLTHTVLYCTVLYCTVLYCTVLYCTVLYCIVLYCTVLYCTVLYCTVLYCTVLYCYKLIIFSVDATAESGYLDRLVNHSIKRPNLMTKIVEIGGTPHLVLVALKDIPVGEELLYDYGDRDAATVALNPWLTDS